MTAIPCWLSAASANLHPAMHKKLHQVPHSSRVEKRHPAHIQHKARGRLRPHLLQEADDRFQH